MNLVEAFVGVAGDADCGPGVVGVFPDRGDDTVLVADPVAGAVGDDELDAAEFDARYGRQVDRLGVDVPPHAGERPVRERPDLVDDFGRLEIPRVDGVIGRFDPFAHPVRESRRPPGDVRVTDDRHVHTSPFVSGPQIVVPPERKRRVGGGRSAAMPRLVTCLLRHRTTVLLGRRTDSGRWDAASTPIDDDADPVDGARRVVGEVTGRTDATLVRAGDPLTPDADRTVYPFVFAVESRSVAANARDHEWVAPPAIRDRPTVPWLWDAYAAVAPTVETVAEDTTHGSAWLSVRALEALRDRAAVADGPGVVERVAHDLRTARPSMAAVAARIDRVMANADPTPGAVRDRAQAVAEEALDADAAAAANAADRCGDAVVTLSLSGTVRSALDRARPAVLIGESRPGGEGSDVAADLAEAGLDVTLTTDSALASELADRDVDAALVGADAVLADGSVVNKVGTRSLALAADREGVPLWVVAAAAKIRPDERVHGETADAAEVYGGDAPVSVATPVFDRTPADLVAGVVTERGVLDGDGVRTVAATHRSNAAWVEERA